MAKRKRDSWGSITEIERGKRYRIRYMGKDEDGSYRRMSATVRGSRRDAERRRSELMLDHSDEAPCPTVRQVWEKWALPAYERRVDDGEMSDYTLRQYKSGWNKHAEPRWGDVSCDAIRPLHVQQWLDRLTYNGALNGMNVLRPTLDYAVRYGSIQTNPFREKYLMPSKSKVVRRDKGVWTLEELGAVWRDHAIGTWWEAPFLLCAFGGCRVGESLGVLCDEVELVEVRGIPVCMVKIDRQMPNAGKTPKETLKTKQSHRTIAIPGRAGKRLSELSRACSVWMGGDGLGGPSTQRRLMLAWKSACDEMDEGLRHPYQNLRNSYETNMRWVMKMPPWIVEPMLGHAGEGVTGQFYDRPLAEMFADAVADAYAANPFDATWEWAKVS